MTMAPTMDDFLIRALLAGTGLVLATAPLGCFVIWRRMAFFGDAMAHAALLGVALALALSLPVGLGVLAVALVFALLLLRLTRGGETPDTVLGVLSHGALALGLVAVALLPGVRVDLESLLFGDILAVGARDVALIWTGSAGVLAVALWRWQGLVTASLGPDLARAAGLKPERDDAILTLLLALTVALSLKVVGALLISALLILPAAAARGFARSPEAMAVMAAIAGAASVAAGLALSFAMDTPAGPSIIVSAACLYAAGRMVRR